MVLTLLTFHGRLQAKASKHQLEAKGISLENLGQFTQSSVLLEISLQNHHDRVGADNRKAKRIGE